jgi:hypothetical protein
MKKDASDGFAFRYPLSSAESRQSGFRYENAVVELFRQQVVNLLDVVELTYRGERVQVDGFAFLCEPGKSYSLYRPPSRDKRAAADPSSE